MAAVNGANKRSNRQRVYETLRKRIVSLELAPGASLSENELAAAMSVSRTPVRESLILLADEGLVRIFPKLGSFVARIDPGKVADAQFIREAIELASIADAVERVDDATIDGLRSQIVAQRDTSDLDDFFALDEQFHRSLLEAGGHGSAWRTVVGAKAHLDRARRLGLLGSTAISVLIDEHEAVVDGLADRDLATVQAALRAHLRKVFADIGQIRDASPELFAIEGEDSRPTRRIVSAWE